MTKACSIVLLVLALAGCGGMPKGAAPSSSNCFSPTSYECQIEMYMKAGA